MSTFVFWESLAAMFDADDPVSGVCFEELWLLV